MKTVKLKGRFVIGHYNNEHVIYNYGEVVYKGDSIIFVGKEFTGEVDETIDTGLSIISPGFIDLEADIDTDHALTDVAVRARKEDAFVMGDKFRTVDPYTDEDFKVRQTYSIAQLIKNGITTAMPIEGETFHAFCQSYNEHEILAKVGIEMGMRLYVGPSFRSFLKVGADLDKIRSEKSFADAIRHFENFDGKGEGLIRGFINPCQIRWTEEEVLLRALRFAEDKNAPMRLHACENPSEWDYTKKLGAKTTIDYFEKIGLLSKNLLIPHCIIAKNSELEKIAKHGVTVITTPYAEAHGGSALFSFAKYHQYGINITIGTDTQPLDMILNMRFARDLDAICSDRQLFNRYNEDDTIRNTFEDEPEYKQVSPADFYNAATINGAKALNRTDIGKLEAGAKADIIVINLNDINVGPYEDPIRTMILNTVGNNVTHTIINGNMLMKDRKLVNIDENALMIKAQAVYEKFLNLHEEYDKYNRPKSTFFPPSFRIMN